MIEALVSRYKDKTPPAVQKIVTSIGLSFVEYGVFTGGTALAVLYGDLYPFLEPYLDTKTATIVGLSLAAKWAAIAVNGAKTAKLLSHPDINNSPNIFSNGLFSAAEKLIRESPSKKRIRDTIASYGPAVPSIFMDNASLAALMMGFSPSIVTARFMVDAGLCAVEAIAKQRWILSQNRQSAIITQPDTIKSYRPELTTAFKTFDDFLAKYLASGTR